MKRATCLAALFLVCLANRSWGLPAAGDDAPAFALSDLSEPAKVVKAELLFAGKTTLLSFFATWCKPCEKEIPELRALALDLGGRGFQVVLISLDQAEIEEIRAFLEKAGAKGLQTLRDEGGEAMDLYGVFNLPTNVVVDASGKVLMGWQGYQENKLRDLRELVEKLPEVRHEGLEAPQAE